MKCKRNWSRKVIKKLLESATLSAGGQSEEAVCKKLEVSAPSYHRWRQEYGGGKEEAVKRLEALEQENTQLKKLVPTCRWTKRCPMSWWRESDRPGAQTRRSRAP